MADAKQQARAEVRDAQARFERADAQRDKPALHDARPLKELKKPVWRCVGRR